MKILFENYLKMLTLLCSLGVLFGSVACNESASTQIEDLEERYRKIISENTGDQSPEEVWDAMRELAQAYESRATNGDDPDQAAEDLYRAAELYENTRDIGKVLSLFDLITSDYPQHNRAPDALFKKGFVYHNVLGDTAQARKAYSEFISRYPNDSLVKDAEMEIKYLGVPPNELLERIREEAEQTENN